MYQAIGLHRILWAYGVATCLLLLAWGLASPPASWWEWWKLVTASAGAVGTAVTAVGQSPLFPMLCRLPLVNRTFPNLHGAWIGELRSNWPMIAARAGLPSKDAPSSAETPALTQPTAVRVTFRITLFWIVMSLQSEDAYSSSKTSFVRLLKDKETGQIRLEYMYENTTKHPATTDSAHHWGAAYLDVLLNDRDPRLDGVYWTNRNWQRGLNTAGTVVLRRSPSYTWQRHDPLTHEQLPLARIARNNEVE